MRAPALVFAEPCRECGGERFTATRRNQRVRLSCERCLHTRWEDAEVASRSAGHLPPRVEESPGPEQIAGSTGQPPPRPPAFPPVFPVEGMFRDQDVAAGYAPFRPIHPRNPDGSLHERDVRRWQLRQAEIVQEHRRRARSPWVTDESARFFGRG